MTRGTFPADTVRVTATARRASAGFAAISAAAVAALVVTAVAVLVWLVHLDLIPTTTTVGSETQVARGADLVLCVVVVAGGWAGISYRPRVSLGLAVTGLAVMVPMLASWTDLSAGSRAMLLSAAPYAVVGLALVATGWTTSTSNVRSKLLVVTLALATAASVVHVLGYDPLMDPACNCTCDAVAAPLADALGARSALGLCAALVLAATFTVLSAILREGKAPPSVRLAAALAAVLVAISAAVPWWRWGAIAPNEVDHLLQATAAILVGAATLFAFARAARMRHSVQDVLLDLNVSSSGRFSAVQFAVPGEDRWVDVAGQSAPDDAQHNLVLSDGSGPTIRLVLTRQLRWDASAVLRPAHRIALENARLTTLSQLRSAQIRSSQRRIVTATDAERRRIERDLHDGAQQVLISAAIHVRAARNRCDAPTAETLRAAEAHLRDALGALRLLSHGTYPTVLADEGLPAAVEEASVSASVPVHLDVRLDHVRHAPDVDMAAFVVITAALTDAATHQGVSEATVSLYETNGLVSVRVADDGRSGRSEDRLSGAADRVGALGGELTISHEAGTGTVITAVIPCG